MIRYTSDVVKRLDSKGVDSNDLLSSGGIQKTTFVNEPNLYRVIFRSDKPQAKAFQDWVFEEVLPEIRKTGGYSHANDAHVQLLKEHTALQSKYITLLESKPPKLLKVQFPVRFVDQIYQIFDWNSPVNYRLTTHKALELCGIIHITRIDVLEMGRLLTKIFGERHQSGKLRYFLTFQLKNIDMSKYTQGNV